LATALFAWLFSREVARPLVQLAGAARAIAAGQAPSFPQSRAPDVAQHILALRAMHEQLDQRFAELRREREETATLIETMADGVLAADARGGIVTLNTAARGAGTQSARFAQTILSNARRMQRLVDDLLDLSRIESGGWQPVLEPVDVAGVARETWVPFADRARDRRIDFTVTVAPPGDGAGLAADPDALRQILTNLFDNALRYTPPGGRIVVAAGPTTGGTLLTVSDNGSGITGH